MVITHGTDAMEETAFFVDLFHGDERPVVFTGAQRPADAADPDGPVQSPRRDRRRCRPAGARRGRAGGVRRVGVRRPGARARPTRSPRPRSAIPMPVRSAGSLPGASDCSGSPIRVKPLEAAAVSAPLPRVDIVGRVPRERRDGPRCARRRPAASSCKPPVPATRPRPSRPRRAAWLPAAPRSLVSTRVSAGPVVPLYSGDGGGVDLVAAGAIPAGRLRPGQARMLLIGLLATGATADDVRRAFALC